MHLLRRLPTFAFSTRFYSPLLFKEKFCYSNVCQSQNSWHSLSYIAELSLFLWALPTRNYFFSNFNISHFSFVLDVLGMKAVFYVAALPFHCMHCITWFSQKIFLHLKKNTQKKIQSIHCKMKNEFGGMLLIKNGVLLKIQVW